MKNLHSVFIFAIIAFSASTRILTTKEDVEHIDENTHTNLQKSKQEQDLHINLENIKKSMSDQIRIQNNETPVTLEHRDALKKSDLGQPKTKDDSTINPDDKDNKTPDDNTGRGIGFYILIGIGVLGIAAVAGTIFLLKRKEVQEA